jgi:hypothetical protein
VLSFAAGATRRKSNATYLLVFPLKPQNSVSCVPRRGDKSTMLASAAPISLFTVYSGQLAFALINMSSFAAGNAQRKHEKVRVSLPLTSYFGRPCCKVVAMKRLFFAFLIGWPGIAPAQQSVDIVGIRDNFIVAGIAAQKCNTGDPDKQDVHDRNFTIISRKALETMIARAPGTDPEELRKQDLTHIEELQDAAFNLINAEGCNSEKVRALLRMHRLHETVRF